LALALTLVLGGVSASFGNEASRSVTALHADGWVVPAGTHGPFMSSSTMPADQIGAIAAAPGVKRAAPVAILRATAASSATHTDVNVIGVAAGQFTDPPLVDGRAPRTLDEATADRRLGYAMGATIRVGSVPFRVVGHTSGLTFRAGIPTMYVSLAAAQVLAYAGRPLATALVTQGVPVRLPAGTTLLSNRAVRADLLAPLVNARKTIGLVSGLLWLMAALIIGLVVYLAALDRIRDFAVFKAVGGTNRTLLAGLIVQSLLVAGAACIVGAVLSTVLGSVMPMKAEIAHRAYVLMALLGGLVAVVASGAGVRRALAVDPALAFGGS
jgi:putative ABC transport system permease protein